MIAVKIENLSKQYRLGLVSTRTLSHDLNRWWTVSIRGKEDPYLKIGETAQGEGHRAQSTERRVQDAGRTTQGAEQRAKSTVSHAPCSTPVAPCSMPHAQSSTLHAPCPKLHAESSASLRLRGLKGNDYLWALHDINLEVEQGEVLGIIGKNGAGKSTLLKILSKVTAPTTGTVKARGRIASLLEVGTGFHSEMTGRENIYMNGAIMGMTKAEITRKLDEIIDFAGVEQFIDTPVKRYSSGMTVRLGFAVAAHLEPEILVVDEVLAVGDAEFQEKAVRKMEEVSRGDGRTILYVSHNLSSVRKLCTSGILLEKGKIKQKGEISLVVEEYLQEKNQPKNRFLPADNIVKEISASQIKNKIILKLCYESEKPLKQPNFGFIVYDNWGNPVFGTNPLKSGITEFGEPKKNGQVEAVITSPQLVDGKYNISVWFSEGVARDKHIFQEERCLCLDIRNKLLNPETSLGPVLPSVDFIFT